MSVQPRINYRLCSYTLSQESFHSLLMDRCVSPEFKIQYIFKSLLEFTSCQALSGCLTYSSVHEPRLYWSGMCRWLRLTPVSSVHMHSLNQPRVCREHIKPIMVVSLPETPVKFLMSMLVHCMSQRDPQTDYQSH